MRLKNATVSRLAIKAADGPCGRHDIGRCAYVEKYIERYC
jgi:hypothetical protein